MTVKARLEGDVFDLDALVELFAEGEPRVSKESDGYYLASAQLDGLIDDGGRLVATGSLLLLGRGRFTQLKHRKVVAFLVQRALSPAGRVRPGECWPALLIL
jgi:hypothetical protein